ncbi:MAG TPA: carbohydrate ABC transporter permease [Anaerolineae bacterium]|nr:carbohydrate ABC transporter permease [Anaerolineae bacterium]
MNRYRLRKRLRILLIHLALITISLLVAAPLIFALIKSTQTTVEVFSYPPKITPGHAGMTNYLTAWHHFNLGRLMLNSAYIAVVVTVGKTIISIFAALALVYFDFPFKNGIFLFILITLMLPVPVRIVPLFDLVRTLKWGDTYWALTIPFFASATGTFLFRQHFMSVPSSLVDAARIDGAGPLRFMIQILIPMSMNTIGALAVIEVIYMWNQYLWPLIIISSNDKQVIQLGMKMLVGAGAVGMTNWGVAMAGAVIAMLPPLIVFLILQEQFMRGFALAGEK